MATTSLNDWTFHKFNIFTHSNGAVEFDVDIIMLYNPIAYNLL